MALKIETVLTVAAVGVGAYLVYKLFNTAASAAGAVGAAVQQGYQSTVSALGSGLYKLFGPADIGTNLYYTVTFPDNSRHAVPSNTVDSTGAFTWTGYPPGSVAPQALQLVKDSNGQWYATDPTGQDFGVTNPGSWN